MMLVLLLFFVIVSTCLFLMIIRHNIYLGRHIVNMDTRLHLLQKVVEEIHNPIIERYTEGGVTYKPIYDSKGYVFHTRVEEEEESL